MYAYAVVDVHMYSEQTLIVGLRRLYMACTTCQNITKMYWSSWNRFCDDTQGNKCPGYTPPNIAIQYWAFLNYFVRAWFRYPGKVGRSLSSSSGRK